MRSSFQLQRSYNQVADGIPPRQREGRQLNPVEMKKGPSTGRLAKQAKMNIRTVTETFTQQLYYYEI